MKLLDKLKFPSSSNISKTVSRNNLPNLYHLALNDLSGNPIQFSDFQGKHLLIVNVASQCGFTPQYRDLQRLSEQYHEQLVVIGVPCNQFGRQEPGSSNQIQSFCERNYGVTFLLTEKIQVKGSKQHPLYTWLTQKNQNGVKNSSVKWNFQKYLIDDAGRLVDYFYSMTAPSSFKITQHLGSL